jgi:hypothetical protein
MKCGSCGKEIAEGSTTCPFCFAQTENARQPVSAFVDREFADRFNRATTLWKDNLGNLILFTLVFALVGWIPIINAAFFAGYSRGLIKLTRGGKAKAADIFSAWDCFGNALAYCLILLAAVIVSVFIPVIGPVAQFVVTIFGAPGFFQVIDGKMNALDALMWSVSTVQRHILPWLLTVIVSGILSSIGMVAMLVGILITLPWGALLLIQQYEAVKGEVA